MKRIFLVLCTLLLLQGCFLRLERVAELTPIKPERDYWIKSNMSDALRQTDWAECGGSKNGMWSPNLSKDVPDKIFDAAFDEKIKEIMACMRAKGYVRGKGGEDWLPS